MIWVLRFVVSTKQGAGHFITCLRALVNVRGFSVKEDETAAVTVFVQLTDKTIKKRSLALICELIPALWNITNLK